MTMRFKIMASDELPPDIAAIFDYTARQDVESAFEQATKGLEVFSQDIETVDPENNHVAVRFHYALKELYTPKEYAHWWDIDGIQLIATYTAHYHPDV